MNSWKNFFVNLRGNYFKIRGQIERAKEFESRIHPQENAFKKLEIVSDNNEQYNRHSCLHIQGIEIKVNGAW